MAEKFHFEFIEDGEKQVTRKVDRGTTGLTDLGVRTMVVEHEKKGRKDIKVFLDGKDVSDIYRPTDSDRQL